MLSYNVMHLTHNNSFLITSWVQFIFLSGYEGKCECGGLWLELISHPLEASATLLAQRDLLGRQYPIGLNKPGCISKLSRIISAKQCFCAPANSHGELSGAHLEMIPPFSLPHFLLLLLG